MKTEFSGKIRAMCFLNTVLKSRKVSVQKPTHCPSSDPENHFSKKILIFGHSGLSGTMQGAGSLRHSGPPAEGRLQVTNPKGMLLDSVSTSGISPAPSPPLPGAPPRTYSAASSRKQHLRILGSSSCAGSARRGQQDND